MTQIFLFQNAGSGGSFPDPGNWNPFNSKIECVGNGSNGGTRAGGPPDNNMVAGGGGGAAYAVALNVNLTFPVPYFVSPSTNIGGQNDPATNFGINYASWIAAPPGRICGAGGGNRPQGGPGGGTGFGATNFYPSGFSGGAGAPQDGDTAYAGGGGGAAGPSGNGGNAQSYSSSTPGNGGSANGGTTAGGVGGSASGNSGNEWGIYGCGSGGAGSSNHGTNGGAGGKYGGGGGAVSFSGGGSGGVGGAGSDGLIVLTYVPLPKIQSSFIA